VSPRWRSTRWRLRPDQPNIRPRLDEIRKTISPLRKPEAGKFQYSTILRRIQAELAELRVQAEDDVDLMRIGAEVADALRDWPRAVEYWNSVVRLSTEPDPDDIAKLALSHSRAGNFPAALEFVRKLGSRPSAERRRVMRQVDEWTAAHLLQRSHHFRSAGDLEQADALLEAALYLQGRSAHDVKPLVSAVSHVERYRTNPELPGDSVGASPGRQDAPALEIAPLFVSGFLYSGSGAVVAYLKDVPGVSTEFGIRELGLFFGSYGPWKILYEDQEHIRRHVANFAMWSLLGVSPPYVSPPHAPKASLAHVLTSPEARSQLRSIAVDLVDELSTISDVTDLALKSALGRALTRTLAIASEPAEFLMLNNTMRPYQLPLLDLLPGGRVVAVLRDPRDQFVAQQVESPDPISVEQFVVQTKERLQAYYRYIGDGPSRDRVVTVRFEEFVSSAGAREELLRKLGLTADKDMVGTSFDPAASKRNIGIYKKHGSTSDIQIIERELAEYIDLFSAR
jgi:hypothetical protein